MHERLIDLVQPQDPIADRAKAQGTDVDWWTVSNDAGAAANVAKGKNVALVFITADSGCVYSNKAKS